MTLHHSGKACKPAVSRKKTFEVPEKGQMRTRCPYPGVQNNHSKSRVGISVTDYSRASYLVGSGSFSGDIQTVSMWDLVWRTRVHTESGQNIQCCLLQHQLKSVSDHCSDSSMLLVFSLLLMSTVLWRPAVFSSSRRSATSGGASTQCLTRSTITEKTE
jgi:hypothetical protein